MSKISKFWQNKERERRKAELRVKMAEDPFHGDKPFHCTQCWHYVAMKRLGGGRYQCPNCGQILVLADEVK